MRSLLKKTALFLTIGLLFANCEREIATPVENESYDVETPGTSNSIIETKDGMLAFKDQAQLDAAINLFASMTTKERITWGQQNQIKTLQIISDEISIAQNEFEKEYYKGIEPGLSIEELEKTGKPAKFCDLYNTYLKKGVITQIREEDGSYSTHLSLLSPGIIFIANEQGFYIVNDSIHLRTNDFLAIKKYEGGDDLKVLKNAEKDRNEEIVFFNFKTGSRTTNQFYLDNIFGTHGTLGDPTWYYESSHKRFKHYVDFKSSISESLFSMTTEFYTEARAESRPYWSWDKDKHWGTSNNYNPIDYINGSWQYSWKRLNWETSFGQYFYNNLSGGTSDSPFMLNPPGTTNLLGTTLNPNGVHSLSYPYAFDVPVLISQMHIHGYFPGVTGTYHTNYYY
ncbi:MAG: hypothetical protein MI974_07660 [Chitinophagales bacterium]|nr:hypothetical protein [Chitinophagales bacterium]